MAVARPLERHGMSKTREYRIWKLMLNRCRNHNSQDWTYYGGRGIKVCAKWANSFTAFIKDLGPAPAGFTIDRIDNDKDYEPGNCRWASRADQSKNQRRCYWLVYKGVRQHIVDWAEETGIPRQTILDRIHDGWSVEKALTYPVRTSRRQLTYKGKTQSIADWSRECGISQSRISQRLRCGKTIAHALETPVRRKRA